MTRFRVAFARRLSAAPRLLAAIAAAVALVQGAPADAQGIEYPVQSP